ncbi:MAG: alkaline phosphatase [Saprospiraceae bacterium]|jgi:alkaline phosphatase
MFNHISSLLGLICFLIFVSCSPESSTPKAPKKAKNVIFLIGDGMGLTQMSAGTFSNGNTSNFEKCEYIGLHKPYASNMLITDSAAGATAFACGVKTYNAAIGVNADTLSVKTILEEAEERGLATGLIATSSIVHATPASFIAHNKFRKNYEDIAEAFLDTEIDYFVGGGKKHFDARNKDDRNLIKELEEKGYLMSTYFEKELNEIEIPTSQNFGYLTSSEEPLPHAQGREYLSIAVSKGLDHLSSRGAEDGFFLMIEGSQIDWGGHANMIDYVIDEWKEFNTVIGEVIEWAEKDGETLVVITADHETGGLAIQKESKMDSIVAAFTSDYHTGTMIPVYSYGVGAEKFKGIYENTAICNKIKEAFGWNQPEE